MHGATYRLQPVSDIPIVGRQRELQTLTRLLDSTQGGRGGTWSIQGPIGIGKTRLVKWLEKRAVEQGFNVRWGLCFKESMSPLFPWQQVFRKATPRTPREESGAASSHKGGPVTGPVLLLEGDKSEGLGKWLAEHDIAGKALLISRDKPASVRERLPALSSTAMLWLTRVEGEGNIHPSNIDLLGERIDAHLRKGVGNILALEGLEYLVSQSNFGAVYNFLQFLRDLAQEVNGHIVISFRPSAFDKREVSLLETLGDILKEEVRAAAEKSAEGPDEPLSTVMLKYLDTIEGLASHQPLLLILEDIQWADPPSMKVLQFLSRNIKELPVALVATIRTESGGKPAKSEQGPGEENPMHQILENMSQEGCLQDIELSGLGEEDRPKVAQGMVGAPIVVHGGAAEFETFLHRTEGNPYLIISAMQMLAEEGRISRNGEVAVLDLLRGEKHGSGSFVFPLSVQHAARERLRNISPEDEKVLRAASVAGQEFPAGAVAAALHLPVDSVVTVCLKLEKEKGFLKHLPGKEDRWSFADPVTHEGAYARVPPEDLHPYAEATARWWVEHNPSDVETIARLYYEAKDPVEGPPYLRRAIEAILARGTSDMVLRAHRWLQEMLFLSGQTPEARVREGLGIARLLSRKHGVSWAYLAMLEELRALDAPFPLPELCEVRIIRAYGTLHIPTAVEHLGRLNDALKTRGGEIPFELTRALLVARIYMLVQSGQYVEMQGPLEEGLALFKDVDAAPERTSLLYWKALSLSEQGKIDEATSVLEEFKRTTGGGTSPVIDSNSLEAQLLAAKGMFVSSRNLFKINYESAKREGRVEAALAPLYNCALMDIALQNPKGARQSLDDAKLIVQRFGCTEWLDSLTYLEGEILLLEGRWKEASTTLNYSLEGGSSGNLGTDAPHAGIALATALLHLGLAEEAALTLRSVEKGETRIQISSLPRFYRVKGLVEEALGRPDEARSTLLKSIAVATGTGNMLDSGLSRWELARIEEHVGNGPMASELVQAAKDELYRSQLPPEAYPWAKASASKT